MIFHSNICIQSSNQRQNDRVAYFNMQLDRPISQQLQPADMYTVGLLYSCLQVGHGHWCLIWLLIRSFAISFTASICDGTF